jgi:hypothetical protein
MPDTELISALLLDITDFLTFQGCILNPSQEALLALVNLSGTLSEGGHERAYLERSIERISSRLYTLACHSTELVDSLRRRVFLLSSELDKACLSS